MTTDTTIPPDAQPAPRRRTRPGRSTMRGRRTTNGPLQLDTWPDTWPAWLIAVLLGGRRRAASPAVTNLALRAAAAVLIPADRHPWEAYMACLDRQTLTPGLPTIAIAWRRIATSEHLSACRAIARCISTSALHAARSIDQAYEGIMLHPPRDDDMPASCLRRLPDHERILVNHVARGATWAVDALAHLQESP